MAQDHACPFTVDLSFPGGASGKEPVCQCRRCKKRGFYPWVRKIPWRRVWQPTPVSCLENPIDRGAWRASPTWLKWLSTHSRTVGLVSRGFNSPNTQISNFLGFMISGKFWMARILLVPITSEFRLMGDKEVGKEPGFFPRKQNLCPISPENFMLQRNEESFSSKPWAWVSCQWSTMFCGFLSGDQAFLKISISHSLHYCQRQSYFIRQAISYGTDRGK